MKYYMSIWDVGQGLVKAWSSRMLIAGDRLPARLRGARRAPRASAASPPSAIVAGIFAIILADAVFTVLFNVW